MTSITRPRTLVYQVFVDRFAGVDGRPLRSDAPAGSDPWRHHAGGTLGGIAARLDHIAELGADALYLTPVFRAPSNHKYDTSSFDEIDARFGGGAEFDRLAAACEAKGMGLILDGVFNHVGEEHGWFREAKAAAGAGDPPARFFKFTDHPAAFECWRGMGWLPELDLASPAVLDALFDGDQSVLRRWLRRGATGWRLDCANDLGLGVCARAARVAREEGAADGVLGEVMTWAEAWVAEGRLDGVMNYWFRESVIGMAQGGVAPVQVAHNLERMAAAWRPAALDRSWNVLGSHDTPRLATLVPDARARAMLRVLAFTCPGIPFLYYGDEVGLEGGADPDNRRVMEWDATRWDAGTLAHVKTLAALRRDSPALQTGRYVPFPQPGAPSLIAFARVTEDPRETVVVVANGTPSPVKARVWAPYSFLFDALPLQDRGGGNLPATRVAAGSFAVDLPEWGAAVYVPEDGTIPNYSFFR